MLLYLINWLDNNNKISLWKQRKFKKQCNVSNNVLMPTFCSTKINTFKIYCCLVSCYFKGIFSCYKSVLKDLYLFRIQHVPPSFLKFVCKTSAKVKSSTKLLQEDLFLKKPIGTVSRINTAAWTVSFIFIGLK